MLGVNGAVRCCWRWSGRAPTTSAALLHHGRNLACRAACFLPTWRCWHSALGLATSSSTGAGAFRLRCRIVLVGIGLWIRLGILETPMFQRLVNNNKIEQDADPRGDQEATEGNHPFGFAAHVGAGAVLHLHGVYLRLCGRHACTCRATLILTAVLVAACVSFVTIPLSGHISDRIGRKKMYMIGAVAIGLFGFSYFGIGGYCDPGCGVHRDRAVADPARYAIRAAGCAHRGGFTPRLRYSGASLGYQLASVFAGGPAPLIATALFATYRVRICDRDLHRRLRRRQPGICALCPTTRAEMFRRNTTNDDHPVYQGRKIGWRRDLASSPPVSFRTIQLCRSNSSQVTTTFTAGSPAAVSRKRLMSS